MIQFDYDNFKKLTYLKIRPEENRAIPLFPYYNQNKGWELWISVEEKLQKIQINSLIEGKYFARESQSNLDFFFEPLDFLVQRAYSKDNHYFIDALIDDLVNLATSFKKIEIFHKHAQDYNASRFIITEMEYIFMVCRSIFDLLQQIINQLIKPKIKVNNLPNSFRKIVIGEKGYSVAEIQQRYNLPLKLIHIYVNSSKFFMWMRNYRDNISHRGKSFEIIYFTEDGFCIPISMSPFSEVRIWNEKNTKPNNIGSVKSFIASIIQETLNNFRQFIEYFEKEMEFPEQISPGNKLFIKADNISELINISDSIHNKPWY